MSNINNWAKDKPILLAMLAIELAVDAEYCFECAKQIKEQEGFIYRLPIPPLDEWLALYKNHHRMFDVFKSTFIDSRGLVELTKDFSGILSEGLREIKKYGMEGIREEYYKLDEEEKEEADRIFKEGLEPLNEKLDKIYELQLQDIHSDINGEIDEELEKKIKRDMNKPEIKFLLQVFVPCFIIYRNFPIRLLRKARKGNIKSIEDLIRLDRSIIHDKKIAEFLHAKKNHKMIDDKIASAMSNGINEKVTRKKMKMNMAGLISYVTMSFGRKFREREIRELFDAIAKDKGESDIDTDIPDSPESFAKAIQRERQNWRNALNNSRSFT